MWNPILLDAVAGALSEAACVFALYPIDTIKSRRQVCVCERKEEEEEEEEDTITRLDLSKLSPYGCACV